MTSPLPDWLAGGNPAVVPTVASGRLRTPPFVSLRASARALAEANRADNLARNPGWLSYVNAGPKLVVVLALLVGVSLLRRPEPIAVVWAAVIVMALTARLPVGGFLGRNVAAAAAFGLLPGLPALFNWLVPGEPLLVLGRFAQLPFHLPTTLAVTQQGLRSFFVSGLRWDWRCF